MEKMYSIIYHIFVIHSVCIFFWKFYFAYSRPFRPILTASLCIIFVFYSLVLYREAVFIHILISDVLRNNRELNMINCFRTVHNYY